MELIIVILCALTLGVAVAALVYAIIRIKKLEENIEDGLMESDAALSKSLKEHIGLIGERLAGEQKASSMLQAQRLDSIDRGLTQSQQSMAQSMSSQLLQMETRLKSLETGNEQKLENMRATIEQRLNRIQLDNNQRLDEMRRTVDEKLQKTLESKMTQSFQLVNERLEQVYKGLGEMQTLAAGVGDLKKVLSNVKTRGILGEIQLGAILEEILTPEQYEKDAHPKPNSRNVVEYAVKLPVEDGKHIFLPIDAKFPGDAYSDLQTAYETGSAEAVQAAAATLCSRLKQSAKDIRDKYICPPYTTEFALMFLPFEGLYSEAVNRGMVEVLQRDYKVNIAGPSTMAALLNSLQMGFKTVAIQKRSSEVWNVLGAVKTEFDKFEKALLSTQNRLEQANKELDALVGVRTRTIMSKLRNVQKLDDGSASKLLGIDEQEEIDELQE